MRGETASISCTASASTSASSSLSRKDPEHIPKGSLKLVGQEVTNTPGHGAPCTHIIYEAITPHSGIPIDTIAFQAIDTLQSSLTDTQMFFDEFLKESHLGVGANDEGVGGLKDVSGVVGGIGGFSGCVSGIVCGIGGFS